RKLYGAYLRDILDHALEKARQKGIEVQLHHARVTDAALHDDETQRLLITYSKGGIAKEMLADALVLATGNQPPRAFGFQAGLVRGAQHYVADVWNTPEGHIYPQRLNTLSADDEIVIIGTGLTMVDTVLTLRQQGFKGTITALSRHGLLPAVHAHAKPYAHPWAQKPAAAPKTALGLLIALRAEIEKAAGQGYDWRDVIDALRPVTQALWQQLGTRERRKFLSRLFTLWNVHRHRMAPEIYSTIRGLQQSGGLKVVAGKIYYVGSDDTGLTVAYRKRGANRIETIRASLVLNCTGPEYDIAASGHSLLESLRDRELITIGPLRIGIELTAQGTARGRAAESIFPMGTLLVGEKLECTAVPELREQAGQVTQGVLRRLAALRDSERKIHLMMGAWI
ncbi:MAG: hypothetical protein EBV03_00460, partial [Proteobacteria bacterium]|nr:hypothetical protein [Pseudomonadota bacterium]